MLGTPPFSTHIVESAFSDNVPEGTLTRLFSIDSQTDQLLAGAELPVGPLGIDTTDLVGFDIAANDNAAYATLTGASTGLYRINLDTGAATLVGPVAGGPYVGMTLLARGVPLIALRGGNELVRFFSARPGTILSTTTVRGLQPGETLVGIDLRQSNGTVYGVGSTSRIYIVDTMSGVGTPVGPPFAPLLSGTKFGVDVNLQEDYLRVVSDTGQTLRINMNTGGREGGSLPFTSAVAEIAFNRSADGTPSREAYGIDVLNDRLLLEEPFSFLPTQVVGPLGVDTSSAVGFDASPLDNGGFAVLTVGGVPSLYGIDLRTGAATLLGAVGGGGTITGLVAVPMTFFFAEGSTGAFFDTDLLLANPGPIWAPVIITYVTDSGRVITHRWDVGPMAQVVISADNNPRLGATAFSATMSSPIGVPIAVERTMRWDASGTACTRSAARRACLPPGFSPRARRASTTPTFC